MIVWLVGQICSPGEGCISLASRVGIYVFKMTLAVAFAWSLNVLSLPATSSWELIVSLNGTLPRRRALDISVNVSLNARSGSAS